MPSSLRVIKCPRKSFEIKMIRAVDEKPPVSRLWETATSPGSLFQTSATASDGYLSCWTNNQSVGERTSKTTNGPSATHNQELCHGGSGTSVSPSSLNCFRSAARSQCKLASNVLMCAERGRPVTNLAFRTDCRRRNKCTGMTAKVISITVDPVLVHVPT